MLTVRQFRLKNCFSYFISDDDSRECMLVDPVFGLQDLFSIVIEQQGFKVLFLAETHTHPDHASGILAAKKEFGGEILLPESASSKRMDRLLHDGEKILLGDGAIYARYLPGHTADGVVFIHDDFVITGDTLHVGTTGRTNFDDGSPQKLFEGIMGTLMPLGDHLLVYPGHDYDDYLFSTIGQEKKKNYEINVGGMDQFVALKNGQDYNDHCCLRKQILDFNRSLCIEPPDDLRESHISCSRAPGSSYGKSMTANGHGLWRVDAVKAGELVRAGSLMLIDIREDVEVAMEAIQEAKHVPMSLLGQFYRQSSHDVSLGFICAQGARSIYAAKTFSNLGFNGYNIEGGLHAWKKGRNNLFFFKDSLMKQESRMDQRFSAMAELWRRMQDPVLLVDRTEAIVFVNERMMLLCRQYDVAIKIGQNLAQIQLLHKLRPFFGRVLGEKIDIRFEATELTTDNEANLTLSGSITSLVEEPGGISALLVAHDESRTHRRLKDIDNQNRALASANVNAALLVATQEELEESKKRYEDLLAALPNMAVLLFDHNHRFLIAGGEEIAKSGFDADLIKGHTLSAAYPPEVVQLFSPIYDKALVGESSSFEHSYGNLIYQQQVIPVRNSSNEIYAGMVISQNVTSLKQTEREKNELQTQLFHTEKLASIGAVVAGVAHEINNPLAIIKGFSSILAKKLKEVSPIDDGKILHTIDKSIDRIVAIVNGLRTYARSDTDHLESIDINKVIVETIPLVHEIAKKDGIDIRLNLAPDLLYVNGNIGKFQQVLINLVNNARDALHQRPSDRQIVIETFVKEGNVTILVSDNGPGIPEAILGRILEPFFTTKEVGKGTGLGLSISSAIVESFGGSFNVYSKEGEGATFLMTLSRMEQQLASDSSCGDDNTDKALSRVHGELLIIDDESDLCEIIKNYLIAAGASVTVTEDPFEALEIMEQKRFDIVITDMQMPNLTGVDLIRKAREIKCQAGTKFIVITGGITTSYSEEDRGFLREHVQGYLLKPFGNDALLDLVSSLLPQINQQANEVATDAAESKKALSAAVIRGEVLIVDDESDIIMCVRGDLEQEGEIIVTEANSAVEALDILSKKRFDLVITDLMMPGLHGVDFIKKAREIRSQVGTKFVVMTGGNIIARARNDDDSAFLKNEIDGYLTKPFDTGKLMDIVRRLLTS